MFVQYIKKNQNKRKQLCRTHMMCILYLLMGGRNIKCRIKRDVCKFDIVNYPFMDSNLPLGPVYGVNISRLITFSRICGAGVFRMT